MFPILVIFCITATIMQHFKVFFFFLLWWFMDFQDLIWNNYNYDLLLDMQIDIAWSLEASLSLILCILSKTIKYFK